MSETETTEEVVELVELPEEKLIPTSGKPVKGVRQIPNPPRVVVRKVFTDNKAGKYQLRHKEKGVKSRMRAADDQERNMRQMYQMTEEDFQAKIAEFAEKQKKLQRDLEEGIKGKRNAETKMRKLKRREDELRRVHGFTEQEFQAEVAEYDAKRKKYHKQLLEIRQRWATPALLEKMGYLPNGEEKPKEK